jgi:hypothetical protein
MPCVDVDQFERQADCTYRGERYSVRDNGAVFRHPNGKRRRANDSQWTFGKENSANPYLHISGVQVHRIVATAFHGDPPDTKYVVDHIDSNCRNNRPENLRWLTRLENALKNPATRKKIEYLCGSIEAFLEKPSMLNDLRGDPNFGWMRAVTPEEAQNYLARMSIWANSDKKPASPARPPNRKNSFGERAFKPLQKWEVGFGREPGLDLALTTWCAQYMWRAPAYFPCCPQDFGADRLDDYFRNLKAGAVLAYSDHEDFCPRLTVVKTVILKGKASILVMSEPADRKKVIVGIELDEKTKHFIHFIVGSYSDEQEADSAFRDKLELESYWSDAYNVRGII